MSWPQVDIGWIAVQSLVNSFFKLLCIQNVRLNLDDNGIGQSEWEPLSKIREDLLQDAASGKISCANHSWHTDDDDDDNWDESKYERLGFDYFDNG